MIVFYVLNKTWETRACASFLLMRAHVQRCCTDSVCVTSVVRRQRRRWTNARTVCPVHTRGLWVFRRLIPAGEIAPCFRWRTTTQRQTTSTTIAVIFCFRTHFCGFELHTLSRAEHNVSCLRRQHAAWCTHCPGHWVAALPPFPTSKCLQTDRERADCRLPVTQTDNETDNTSRQRTGIIWALQNVCGGVFERSTQRGILRNRRERACDEQF